MNSSIIRYFIRSFSSGGRGFGAPSILENVAIPQFDRSKKVHVELAKLSVKAHKDAWKENTKEQEADEKKINKLVAKVFDLSTKEIAEMV